MAEAHLMVVVAQEIFLQDKVVTVEEITTGTNTVVVVQETLEQFMYLNLKEKNEKFCSY
jgi:hypothetical protein